MKKILVIVLAVILTLSLSLTSVAFAAGGKNEVIVAQEAGQAWLDNTIEPPEWKGARLTTPQICYGLDGQPSAYMFTIDNSGQVVGHIIVGSSAYGYPVFEAADCPPPSIPNADEVKSALKRDLAIDVESVGRPSRLLYLGFDNLFAVYRVGEQEAAVNLVFDFAIPAANLTAAMPSPEVYKANKKATGEAMSDLLESSDYSPLSLSGSGCYALPMTHYSEGDRKWCGPCSGVSIGWYYRTRFIGYGPPYPDLPSTREAMYDRLFDCMGTDSNGSTWPWNYGPGFVAMTEDPDGNPATNDGYDNFHYYWLFWPSHDDYENIVNWINRGFPTAVSAARFNDELQGDPPGDPDWPPPGGHFVAIKGYRYYVYGGNERYQVICTDSYCYADWLYLDWDHMTIGLPPYNITIWDS